MNFIYFLLVGGVAGWLAGLISKGSGFGIIKNILIGIAGAFIGGFCFQLLGIGESNKLIGSIATSTIGALILLWIIGKIKK